MLRWRALAGLLLLSACLGRASAQVLEKIPPRLGYLLYLPKRTWTAKKKWPLILYLHGKSLRGNDLSKVTKYGLAKRLLTDKGFPFIVVCPQLADGERWTDTRALASLVNEIARRYPVDRTRTYAMGFSMGASGVWRVADAYPHMFAAIVSVGGMYETPIAASGKLKSVPAWVIHGTADTEALEPAAKAFFDLYTAKGGKGRFTALEGKGHDIPDVFERSDLYHWLLTNRIATQKVKVVLKT
jgi:predicted peptidase